MSDTRKRNLGRQTVRCQSFSARLARHFKLEDHQEKKFKLRSPRGTLQIKIGKEKYRLHGKRERSVRVEGVIKLQGMEYYLKAVNGSGSGKLAQNDKVSLFDRSAGEYLQGDVPKKVYETLIPFIELGAKELFEER